MENIYNSNYHVPWAYYTPTFLWLMHVSVNKNIQQCKIVVPIIYCHSFLFENVHKPQEKKMFKYPCLFWWKSITHDLREKCYNSYLQLFSILEETFSLHSAISNIRNYGRNSHVKILLCNFLNPMVLWNCCCFCHFDISLLSKICLSTVIISNSWQLIRTGSEDKTMFLIRLNISLNPQCLKIGNATSCY